MIFKKSKKRIPSKSFNVKNIIIAAGFITVFIIMSVSVYGCSVINLVSKAYGDEKEGPALPEVEIDESEVEEIKKGEEDIKKGYVIESEIKLIDDSTRDPFKPFYIVEEEEKENIITLEKIFSKDGVEYAEINFNEYIYNLKETDTISDVYLIQAININSLVLLKGDEIITLYIGIPVYD
jgi:hypothetical protein